MNALVHGAPVLGLRKCSSSWKYHEDFKYGIKARHLCKKKDVGVSFLTKTSGFGKISEAI